MSDPWGKKPVREASPTMSLWDLEDSHSCRGRPQPAQDPEAKETSAELQMKVDFFRKLGYSSSEIHSVLQKLGVQADTNTVLGELVKHGSATERECQASTDPCPQLPLVPRGGSTPKPSSLEPSLPEEDKEGSDLRPVVIDGSNVAMRYVSVLWRGPVEVSMALKKKKKAWLSSWTGEGLQTLPVRFCHVPGGSLKP